MNQNENSDCHQTVDCSQFSTLEAFVEPNDDEVFMDNGSFFLSVSQAVIFTHRIYWLLPNLSPSSSFRGFGGSKTILAGLDLDFDLTSMAVMGFAEVIPKSGQVLELQSCRTILCTWRRRCRSAGGFPWLQLAHSKTS